VCRTSGPLTEGPGPTSSSGSLPALRVAYHCSPVILTDNTFWHAQWDLIDYFIDYIDYFIGYIDYFIDYFDCIDYNRLHHFLRLH
jgi:hypothetical protein